MKIKNKITKKFHINLNSKIENAIFIAGTGRSGTTWLSNIINYKNDYRDIFEPFHSHYTKECYLYKNKQYLNPGNQDHYFLSTTRKILQGKVSNSWINRHNTTFYSKKRLIKDIRANLFLKWLKIHFPAVPIVFILRHPCAVANSKMLLGWVPNLDDYLGQEDLMAEYLVEYKGYITKIKTENLWFKKIICQWAIETLVPLKQFGKNEIYAIFYENICMNPEYEIRKLYKWLGKIYHDEVKQVFRQPSKVTEKHSAILTGDNLIGNWRKNINQEQIETARTILTDFGLAHIYNEDYMPTKESIWMG